MNWSNEFQQCKTVASTGLRGWLAKVFFFKVWRISTNKIFMHNQRAQENSKRIIVHLQSFEYKNKNYFLFNIYFYNIIAIIICTVYKQKV